MYRSGITGVSLSDKDWTRTIGSGQSLELFMLQYYRGTHTHREREREREVGMGMGKRVSMGVVVKKDGARRVVGSEMDVKEKREIYGGFKRRECVGVTEQERVEGRLCVIQFVCMRHGKEGYVMSVSLLRLTRAREGRHTRKIQRVPIEIGTQLIEFGHL
jgi:hypothetical protein